MSSETTASYKEVKLEKLDETPLDSPKAITLTTEKDGNCSSSPYACFFLMKIYSDSGNKPVERILDWVLKLPVDPTEYEDIHEINLLHNGLTFASLSLGEINLNEFIALLLINRAIDSLSDSDKLLVRALRESPDLSHSGLAKFLDCPGNEVDNSVKRLFRRFETNSLKGLIIKLFSKYGKLVVII